MFIQILRWLYRTKQTDLAQTPSSLGRKALVQSRRAGHTLVNMCFLHRREAVLTRPRLLLMAWAVSSGPDGSAGGFPLTSAVRTHSMGPIHTMALAHIIIHHTRACAKRTIAEGASGVETAENLDDMVRMLEGEAAGKIGKDLE